MRIERVQLASTSDMPWTPSRVGLPVEPALIHIQQDGAWKEIGGVIIEMLISMPQNL